MRLIERIENIIEYGKPIDQQLENLSQFDNITENEILELTVHIKSSEVGILIEYLGFEKLRNHLPSFLEFLQDANWPASSGVSKMLEKAREIIIPEIKRVFKEVSNDEIWHYWILILLIGSWDKELVKTLKPELIDYDNLFIDIGNIAVNSDSLSLSFPKEYYKIEGKKAIPLKGNYVEDVFEYWKRKKGSKRYFKK